MSLTYVEEEEVRALRGVMVKVLVLAMPEGLLLLKLPPLLADLILLLIEAYLHLLCSSL